MGIHINETGDTKRPPIKITISGVTGSGKTLLAAYIAYMLDGAKVSDIRVIDRDIVDASDCRHKAETLDTHPEVIGEVTIQTVTQPPPGPVQR